MRCAGLDVRICRLYGGSVFESVVFCGHLRMWRPNGGSFPSFSDQFLVLRVTFSVPLSVVVKLTCKRWWVDYYGELQFRRSFVTEPLQPSVISRQQNRQFKR